MYVRTYARMHAWMKQEKQCDNEVRSRNHSSCGKAINISFLSVCVCVSVASINQLAKRMRRIIFSSVVRPTPSHFSTLSHKGLDFCEYVIEHKMCVLICLYNLCLIHLSL